MRLGKGLEIDAETASQTYYACSLFYVGCPRTSDGSFRGIVTPGVSVWARFLRGDGATSRCQRPTWWALGVRAAADMDLERPDQLILHREERWLQRQFGTAYQRYKSSIRRYL
jgi:protein-S-isoprenylcysteine O-methyltransferase Ste14